MLSLISLFIVAGCNLVISWLMQPLIDTATGVETKYEFSFLFFVTLGLIAVLALVLSVNALAQPRFFSRAMRQYKDFAYSKLVKKSITAFAREDTVTYISALSNDLASIETNYLGTVFRLIQELVMFVGALALMLYFSPTLTAVAVALSILPVAASLVAGNKVASAEAVVSDRNASFLSTLKDSLNGFSVIKSFRAERELLKIFAKSNRAAEDAKENRRRLSDFIEMIGVVAGFAAQFGVFLIGGYLALRGQGISAGVLIVFVQLMNFLISPIGSVPGIIANRRAANALIDKLSSAIEENVRDEGKPLAKTLTDAIEVKNLTFSYDGSEEVLRNMSVRFESGKAYAVVGGSGSGKSTLLNLLMGSSDKYTGEILYDGVELRSASSESLYELISVIQQNVFVFNSTIRENITMFRDFDDADVAAAIRDSGLSDLVSHRGEGEVCGEGGCELSGGERQRISIARSLLRKTPVLYVDEATASLDRETAFNITKSILSLTGLTRVVITHALDASLLRMFDGIVVIKNGEITEYGSFDELMNKKGYFYSLYTVSQ